MAARKRKKASAKRRKPAKRRSGGVKGTRLYSDVAAAVKTANKLPCGSPKRKAKLSSIVRYIRSAAELESNHGLNKTTAKRRLTGLLAVDKQILSGMKRCKRSGI